MSSFKKVEDLIEHDVVLLQCGIILSFNSASLPGPGAALNLMFNFIGLSEFQGKYVEHLAPARIVKVLNRSDIEILVEGLTRLAKFEATRTRNEEFGNGFAVGDVVLGLEDYSLFMVIKNHTFSIPKKIEYITMLLSDKTRPLSEHSMLPSSFYKRFDLLRICQFRDSLIELRDSMK